jgi:hypothetical protein
MYQWVSPGFLRGRLDGAARKFTKFCTYPLKYIYRSSKICGSKMIIILIVIFTFPFPTGAKVLSCIWECVTVDGVWICEWTDHLAYNPRNYILQITMRHATSSQSVTVFTNRCLVTDVNNGYSTASALKSRTELLSTVN